MRITPFQKKQLLLAQTNEITEYHVYQGLARIAKYSHSKKVLKQIAQDELDHYNFWKSFTNEDAKPKRFKIGLYIWIARLLGITFGIRLMEKGEESAQIAYDKLLSLSPKVKEVIHDEEHHEKALVGVIDPKSLEHISSIVLGLNDALVELTGALAGFTLALQDAKLIAIAGGITGIAASLSMAASQFLAKREDDKEKHPIRASLYTGSTYLITVIILVLPFFFFANPLISLACTLSFAILIIFFFTLYVSVAKDLSFRRRFLEMSAISLGVAMINFGIGLLIKKYVGEV
ncbi:rubrerythrin family protein [Patescibacteria group bacterium]|nr:rubrerythrin family protein [Patescibacteria group bacterium]